MSALKDIKAKQVSHKLENSPDHRTWAKYAETTFYLTSQWWVLGDGEGDALCGIGPDYECHAVARIGDEIAEVRGQHACLDAVLAKLGYRANQGEGGES